MTNSYYTTTYTTVKKGGMPFLQANFVKIGVVSVVYRHTTPFKLKRNHHAVGCSISIYNTKSVI